jgi:hypothetical protein
MEVTLKKTKITASILKQMEHATIENIFNYKTIGYVNHKLSNVVNKKAILTNGIDYKLMTIPISIQVKGRYLGLTYTFTGTGYKETNSEIEAINLKEQMLIVVKQALELGQIFY